MNDTSPFARVGAAVVHPSCLVPTAFFLCSPSKRRRTQPFPTFVQFPPSSPTNKNALGKRPGFMRAINPANMKKPSFPDRCRIGGIFTLPSRQRVWIRQNMIDAVLFSPSDTACGVELHDGSGTAAYCESPRVEGVPIVYPCVEEGCDGSCCEHPCLECQVRDRSMVQLRPPPPPPPPKVRKLVRLSVFLAGSVGAECHIWGTRYHFPCRHVCLRLGF